MMNKSLNKSKWPYLLLLIVCMVAASTNSTISLNTDTTQPVIVEVQVEKQPQIVEPFQDWLVQKTKAEVNQ